MRIDRQGCVTSFGLDGFTGSTTATASGAWSGKPGAFARYRFREELLPSLTFRAVTTVAGSTGSPQTPLQEFVWAASASG